MCLSMVVPNQIEACLDISIIAFFSWSASRINLRAYFLLDWDISQALLIVALITWTPPQISEALLRTYTDAEIPPRPLLRSFGGLAGGLLSFKSSLHCKDQEPRSWVRPLSQ